MALQITDPPYSNSTDSPGKRVLVVDDNHASRVVAKAIFERENYHVSLAKNGRQGVSIASKEVFDIIIMDIQMSDISGIEATQLIKQTGGVNLNTPVVALTAYADKMIIEDAYAVGIKDILTKPLRIDQLRVAWQRAIAPNETAPPLPKRERTATQPLEPYKKHVQKAPLLEKSIINPLVKTAPEAALKKLYDGFYRSAIEFIADIKIQLPDAVSGDQEALVKVRRTAHALKGAASSVGFIRLSQCAAQLQNAPMHELSTIVAKLTKLPKASDTALTMYLSERKLKT